MRQNLRFTHLRISDRVINITQGWHVAILMAVFLIGGCKPPSPGTSETSFKPQSVLEIAFVQPFRLEKSYPYDWQLDHPEVQSGLLVVLKVDPDLITPRNALEPVLYAGNHTVQRLNAGHESGYVIGIIPGQIDLAKEPVWFGNPNLPERITSEIISKERAIAKRSGISALKSDLQILTRDPIVAPDLTSLLREHAANLVLEFSPQEKRLADTWRLPGTTQ